MADIEDLSRTGVQQALRTALDGIETDGSDLSALVAVVDHIPRRVSTRARKGRLIEQLQQRSSMHMAGEVCCVSGHQHGHR